jgi:hypothetical protein
VDVLLAQDCASITSVLPWLHRPAETFRLAGISEPKSFINLVFKKGFEYPAAGTLETVELLFQTELSAMLPLLDDCYLGVNSVFGLNENNNHNLVPLARGLRYTKRNLQWINACVADLDCYKADPPLDPYLVEADVYRMVDAGLIPAPSIVAHSGRGLYLFWLIRNAKIEGGSFTSPPLPERATPRTIYRTEQINRQFVKRCECFCADESVTNANRWLRLNGSRHTGVNRPVNYKLLIGKQGVNYYSLDELERALAVSAVFPTPQKQSTKRVPNNLNGFRALHQKRLHDYRKIEFFRGGIKKRREKYEDGSESNGRRRFLRHVAIAMRGSGYPRDEAINTCLTFAERCKPSYPSEPSPSERSDIPVKSIVDRVYDEEIPPFDSNKPSDWWIKNETLCSQFGITPQLAAQLELSTLGRSKDEAPPKRTTEERRLFVKGLISSTPSLSQQSISQICYEAGFEGSRTTVRTDLRALGLVPTPESQESAAQASLDQRKLQLERERQRSIDD